MDPRNAIVPGVVGLGVGRAGTLLAQRGHPVVVDDQAGNPVPFDQTDARSVIAQRPHAGAQISEGATVTLIVRD
jgi:beta-lactam-binding protein with PASTA domain